MRARESTEGTHIDAECWYTVIIRGHRVLIRYIYAVVYSGGLYTVYIGNAQADMLPSVGLMILGFYGYTREGYIAV